MENNFIENIVNLCKESEWKKIINEYHNVDDKCKLLWVFPSEDNIDFIRRYFIDLETKSVISVGCGSGLLEWILNKSIGIDVLGIEIDGVWWNCKYAPPSFIPLHLANTCLDKDPPTQDILNNREAALLFCYFNNGPAFQKYVRCFSGNVVIIIGPGEGKYVHTDPAPFTAPLSQEWKLIASQEVRDTKDYIAIYKKDNLGK